MLLFLAVLTNNTKVAQLQVQHNAVIEASIVNNLTPPCIAAKDNRKKVAELLLQHNADVEAKGQYN